MIRPAGRAVTRVFVDTSAFFALADRDDRHFEQAQVIQQGLVVAQSAWFASNFIIAETHSLFLARLGRGAALVFLDATEASSITVVRATDADENRAKSILGQYDDKDFSY